MALQVLLIFFLFIFNLRRRHMSDKVLSTCCLNCTTRCSSTTTVTTTTRLSTQLVFKTFIDRLMGSSIDMLASSCKCRPFFFSCFFFFSRCRKEATAALGQRWTTDKTRCSMLLKRVLVCRVQVVFGHRSSFLLDIFPLSGLGFCFFTAKSSRFEI